MPIGKLSLALASHKAALETIAKNLLSDYTDQLRPSSVPRRAKEFNDPVWKTIVVQPFELIVLDSPLLQRLRLIRQLGVAHWVYPGASHSRFEHSLGVLHQVQRLVTAINESDLEAPSPLIDAQFTNLLRLAGLLHDVGHGVMSHVSENATRTFRMGIDLELDFADFTDRESIHPSEIAAFFIIGSPQFGKLFARIRELVPKYYLPDNPTSLIQQSIIGKTICDAIPLLHEIISGPFDADKLDYMPRDARMSGIPVVTDIARLVRKVRALRLTQRELPLELAKTVREGPTTYAITGIALSGGRTLDELFLGRTLLFDKIYRHQKVRAAECMVASIFHLIGAIVADTPALAPFTMSDEQLLHLDTNGIKMLAQRELSEEEQRRALVAADIAKRLRLRQLFVRCLAFARRMPLDPYCEDDDQKLGLVNLLDATHDFEKRGGLVNEITDETHKALKALDQLSILDEFEGRDLRPYFWIDPPARAVQDAQINRAYLIADNRGVLRFREDSAESRGWADAYLLARDVGYVFAPAVVAQVVHLASEKVFRSVFGVRIPPSMLGYSKQDPDELDALRRALEVKGYYSGSPSDIRPMPDRLTRADVQLRLEDIARNVGRVWTTTSRGRSPKFPGPLTPEWIRNWLRQFEDDDLVDAALEVVEKIRIIGRVETQESLIRFVAKEKDFAGASICILGSTKDSSGVVSYFAADISTPEGLTHRSLEMAIGCDRPILFLDDFISSGGQATNIIESWFGAEGSSDLGEEREGPLSKAFLDALRSRPIGFCFTAGLQAGIKRLAVRAKELGMDAHVLASIAAETLPRAFGSGVISDGGREKRFQECCERIGRELLLDPDRGHDEAWAKDRSLGYGNDGLLVAFPYNTPAHTLTCIWATGSVRGIPWMPLLPRRQKE